MNKSKLTVKQRKWVTEFIETGNATEAAMRAYNCKIRSTAESIGCENLRKLEESVNILMDFAGISDARLMISLAEGLEANRPVIAKHQGKLGETELYPDYATRLNYLVLALKLKGLLKGILRHEFTLSKFDDSKMSAEAYIEQAIARKKG